MCLMLAMTGCSDSVSPTEEITLGPTETNASEEKETSAPVETQPQTEAPAKIVDYADFKLQMNSGTRKQEVTVKSFIDGDTVHFHVPEQVMESGVLKARFLAVNTPESTGKIEEYGRRPDGTGEPG